MKIIYLTTSLVSDDFEALLKKANTKPNPSNQNFHHGLITSLAHHHIVEVVSITPITPTVLIDSDIKEYDNRENHVHYHMIGFINERAKRRKTIKINLINYLEKIVEIDDIIFVDSMNYLLMSIAISWSKKHGNKVIAVLTDNPRYITGLSRLRASFMIRKMKKATGYLSLGQNLLDLVKGNKKPHIIIEGIYENNMKNGNIYKKPYIFFAGSLNSKYGINKLIKAYLLLDTTAELLVAGHGTLDDDIYHEVLKDRSVKLLGTLSKREILQYEAHSLINVNPRGKIKDLDKYSIPSKVIEYAGSGVPTLSGYHFKLQEIYGDTIYWTKASSALELLRDLENILKNPEEAKGKAEMARKITIDRFGVERVGVLLKEFIDKL